GKSQKTLKGEAGEMTIEVPRDRNGSFEPKLIEKHQTRFEGFDAKILSMYALGMTVRDIQGHLQDMYGVEVSAALISEVTDGVLEEVKAWQDRPLEALYPIVYLDALMVKIRQDGKVENRAVHTAIGINMEGQKSVLGLWTNGTEGEAVFPSALVQTCVVHLIRASLNFVNWKERKTVAADLKSIYRAPTAERAEAALAEFRRKYPKHQVVADVWERSWQRVIPFFDFPEEIRKIIYTTNAVESLHMTLRKVTKNRGSFPTQEAAIKLLYLGLQNVSKKWQMVQGWRDALRQFAIRWPERIEQARAA
ncbi:MAG TPA: IS256 family transposase, partial [Bryobacteraceae bacterium]|nr:IS256 family transposase [Bryobacteraceae bacterium]